MDCHFNCHMTKIVQTYLKVKFSTKDLMVHMNGLINYHIMSLKKLLQTILEPNFVISFGKCSAPNQFEAILLQPTICD